MQKPKTIDKTVVRFAEEELRKYTEEVQKSYNLFADIRKAIQALT